MEEVQECLRVANRFQVPIISGQPGEKLGIGFPGPARDNCVLLELDRLNRILEFDETLAYITVEPGVTFRQASHFLRSKETNLFLSVIGGHREASLIGNALERGDGVGPYGEQSSHACALEVVLPDGECVHTGFDRFGNRKSAGSAAGGWAPRWTGCFPSPIWASSLG